ncbi:hypothetical protein DQT32_04980 [Salmonella enterica subsp. enterica serovar Braenderup]|nr:hypothetical protein [Salmonella enterica subsp. enterica serovar Braenderup]
MNQFELMILLFRKNSRILTEYVNGAKNRRNNLIRIKHMISTMKPSLYNIIKTIALDLDRFQISEMFRATGENGNMFLCYHKLNDQNNWEVATYRKLNRNAFVGISGMKTKSVESYEYNPTVVYDTVLKVGFIIDQNVVKYDNLVIFEDNACKIFKGIAGAHINAKKREDDAIRQAQILKQEIENDKKKEELFSLYD